MNIDTMAHVEREIETRFERSCEKDGWIASVAISDSHTASLLLEKFGEDPIIHLDECTAVQRFADFVKEEFGVQLDAERRTETIPNTRNPHHIAFHSIVNAKERISLLIA